MSPKKIADTIRKIVSYFVLLVLHEIFISFMSYHHVWILSTLQFYIYSIINSLPFAAGSWIELFSRLVFPFVFAAILSSKLAVPLQVIDTLASENEAADPRVKIYFGLVTATARKAWSKWRWFSIPILLLYFILAHLLSILISIPLALILRGILTILGL